MPSRSAAALASPRVRTPSLRRIAETWWSTVFSERNSRSAMSALRRPSADELEHLELARGQAGRVLARRARGPRGRPRAPRSRRRRATIAAAGRAPSRCSSSSAARRAPSSSASASASAASYGQPERGPELRGAPPSRPRARARRARRRRRRTSLVDARPAGASRRARRPPTAPAGAARARARRRSRVASRSSRPRSQAASARAAATGPDPLELAGRLGQRERLVEQRPDVGIAAPRAHERRARCSAMMRGSGRGAAIAQDERGGVRRLVPAPAIELARGRGSASEVQPPQIEAALGAVLECRPRGSASASVVARGGARARTRRG